MLYAREVAKTSGDTLFGSMYADYEALSDVLKSTVKGTQAAAFEPPCLRPGHVSEPGRDWGGFIARRASRDEAIRSEEC